MIKERTENEKTINGYYNSSNILSSTYNKLNNILEIVFSSGAKYKYFDVSLIDYVTFETSDSQGKFLNSIIKPKYRAEFYEKINTDLIKEELNVINKSNIKRTKDEIKIIYEKIISDKFSDVNDIKYFIKLLTKLI